MKRNICSGFILLLLLSACSFGGNSQSEAEIALEETRVAQFAAATAQAAEKAILESAVPPTQKATDTVAAPPTETATPEPTATPTEIPAVRAVANVNASCRSGPDKVFPLVELLNAGTSALVIGQYAGNGQWWKVRTDAGKECWVLASNTSTTGDLSIVAMLESPPTPTVPPPPSWDGYWIIHLTNNFNDPEKNVTTITIKINQSGNVITSWFDRQPGVSCSFSATVSDDGMSALGSMQYGSANYKIRFYRVAGNVNQFQGEFYRAGSEGNDGGLCGGTNGAQPPTICRP